MNKADYISLINTKLPDASLIPSSDHRATMHTDPNSIIEVVYGDMITETQALPSIFSVIDADIEYNIKIQKTGRVVNLSGFIKNTGIVSHFNLLSIADEDYKCADGELYISNGTRLPYGEITMTRIYSYVDTGNLINIVNVVGNLMPDEEVYFSLTYNTYL